MSAAIPAVEGLRAEYHRGAALGIGEPSPRLSWRTVTTTPAWVQAAYEIEVDGESSGRVEQR